MKEFGQLIFALGALAYLPSLVDREWLLTAWLGGMQEPLGLSAMLVGGVVFGAAKLAEIKNAGSVAPPTSAAARPRIDEPDEPERDPDDRIEA